MYKLHMPMMDKNDKEFLVTRKLFKEVLGYTYDEIEYFAKTHFSCDVVTNLTLEQAQEICQIFYDNDISIYPCDQKTNNSIAWETDLGIIIPTNPPKSHYCDKPLVTRDHLVDAFTEQEKERQRNIEEARREAQEKAITAKNTLTCPKCGSTAITTGERGYSFLTGFLGSGQTVNRCGNCGHKWKPRV